MAANQYASEGAPDVTSSVVQGGVSGAMSGNPYMAIGGAVLGGLSGLLGASGGKSVPGPSPLEQQANGYTSQSMSQLNSMVGLGPGAQDVTAGYNAQNDLASMLKKYAGGGNMPTEQDWGQANQFAGSAFAGQRVAAKQNFEGQQQRAAQLAAQMGRPVNDPIIQAKLSQEYMQGQERLGADQGAYASQMALQMPQQRLGYTSQLADVRSNLASQAMSNRQALLNMGQQVGNSQAQQRFQTAQLTTPGQNPMGAALNGAIAGYGQFAAVNALNSKAQLNTAQAANGGGTPQVVNNYSGGYGQQQPMMQQFSQQQPSMSAPSYNMYSLAPNNAGNAFQQPNLASPSAGWNYLGQFGNNTTPGPQYPMSYQDVPGTGQGFSGLGW